MRITLALLLLAACSSPEIVEQLDGKSAEWMEKVTAAQYDGAR